MNDRSPLIKLQDISLAFGRQEVLQKISLSLSENSITTLIGPNGAGKTTLVKIVLGLISADSGTIWKRENLRVGYMPQKLHIDNTFPLTVKRFLQTAGAITKAAIEQALADVSASNLLNESIHNLSGGEMQRVLLARALLRQPELLVLDEPVQGVDVNGQTELYKLISQLRDQYHCGVLMISHDLHLVMASTDQVICLNHHICCSGHPEQVSNDPSFHALFGEHASQQLALYNHHHNHRHSIHGDIVGKEEECSHG